MSEGIELLAEDKPLINSPPFVSVELLADPATIGEEDSPAV